MISLNGDTTTTLTIVATDGAGNQSTATRYVRYEQSYGTTDLGNSVGGTASTNSYFTSDQYGNNPAADAFDNNTNTYWCPANYTTTSTEVRLDYDFTSAVNLETINIKCNQFNNANHSFKVVVVTGGSWITTHSGLSFSTTNHSLKIHKKNVTKVRIIPTAGSFGYWTNGSHYITINEVDFLGSKA